MRKFTYNIHYVVQYHNDNLRFRHFYYESEIDVVDSATCSGLYLEVQPYIENKVEIGSKKYVSIISHNKYDK